MKKTRKKSFKNINENQMDLIQEIFYKQIKKSIVYPIQSRYIAFKISEEGNTVINEIIEYEGEYIIHCDINSYKVRPLKLDLPATPIEILIR